LSDLRETLLVRPGADVAAANERAVRALAESEPMLRDVRPALEVVPEMTPTTILTSGPPLAWDQYTGGQRRAILGGVVYEGLAPDLEAAADVVSAGGVTVSGCHDFSCVGSLAGVTTASMPVLVVEDRNSGHRGFCTLFEGEASSRLNYGVWDESVRTNLNRLASEIGPALGSVLRSIEGGVPLLPIMQRAVNQGDELHSRNTAASMMFLREILPALLSLEPARAQTLVPYLTSGDYFFLRPAMAASKVMADRMADVPGSSVVTAMAFSCREFGIRVSGLGDQWFTGPLPIVEDLHLFDGHGVADIEVMGGESPITEVCGLGGFAQAAALTLQNYQGGPEKMIARNREMYQITVAESAHFKIPLFSYRGTPTGIDVHRVVGSRITPVMDVGIAGRAGGQIGAGSFRAPLQPFVDAQDALARHRAPSA
jgi:hypothetical protein